MNDYSKAIYCFMSPNRWGTAVVTSMADIIKMYRRVMLQLEFDWNDVTSRVGFGRRCYSYA